MSRVVTAKIHKCPDGQWRRCIAADCPYGGHGNVVDIAKSGGAVIHLNGHSQYPLVVSEVVDGMFSVAGAERSRTYTADGKPVNKYVAKKWREKNNLDIYKKKSVEHAATSPEPVVVKEVEPVVETPKSDHPYYDYVTDRFSKSRPALYKMMTMDKEDFMDMPKSKRKELVTDATTDVLAEARGMIDSGEIKADNEIGVFAGWNNNSTREGFNKRAIDAWGQETENSIQFSTRLLEREPEKILNTIYHEVSHSTTHISAGHGKRWRQRMSELSTAFGSPLNQDEVQTCAEGHTDIEREKAEERYQQRKWVGQCPANSEHIFFFEGRPRKPRLCANDACADLSRDERVLTYEKNPNYKP